MIILLLYSFTHAGEKPYQPMALQTIDGKFVRIANPGNKSAFVILFLSPECPLCISYSLTIKNIYQKFHLKGVEFAAIIPGKEYTKDNIIAFRNGYGLKMIPFYLDPNLAFAKQIQASITPEVFVLNQQNKIVYSGRIDDWAYELGKKRSVITSHDLENVLEKLINKKPLKAYQTRAVGCFIN